MENGAVVGQCTITSNSAGNSAGGVYANASSARMRNCIVYFNEAFDYDDVFAGYPVTFSNTCASTNLGGTNFTNAPSFAGAAPDFRLAAGSSCIDRGASNDVPTADLLGHPRPVDGDLDGTNAWDVGAYEYSVAITRIAPATSTNVLLAWDVLPGKRYALDVSGPPLTGNWFNVFGTNTYGGPSPAVFTQSFPSALATNLVFRLRAFTGP
jgi:hypothetical protein